MLLEIFQPISAKLTTVMYRKRNFPLAVVLIWTIMFAGTPERNQMVLTLETSRCQENQFFYSCLVNSLDINLLFDTALTK